MEPGAVEAVFRGRIFSVERWTPPGAPHPYEVVRHPGSAAVLAVTPGDRVLLVRQHRPAIGGPLLEVPAGIVDVPGEDPLACAARELFEETGYRHETIEFLGGCYPSAGFSDEYVHLFLARTRAEPEGQPEAGISVEAVPFQEVLASASAGRIRDAKTALAVLLAAARRDRAVGRLGSRPGAGGAAQERGGDRS